VSRTAHTLFSSHLTALVIATALACAAPAAAQEAEALTPPVVRGDTHVPYPLGATGDAVVLLELIVADDGTVTHAEVLEGVEPFAAQARESVLQWRFVPAQRGGTAIAARIRARVEFHPTLPAASGPNTPQPSAAEPIEALDVTIRGRRREIGQTTFSMQEVRALPGAFGDPFRSIEGLPGVTPLVSGFPYFFVRGSPPNNNAYYVDGVRVPLLFHIGVGQSVIHPGSLDRVDFISGAPPASYASSTGAVIAGHTRDPSTQLRAEAHLRLVDAGGLLELPFADGRGSAVVAGRYGYPGPILSAIADDVSLAYWDYQARASWHLTDRDTVQLFALGSHDFLATGSPRTEQFVADFHRVSLRYEHALSDGHVRAEGLFGYDSRGADPSFLTDTSASLRVEVDQGLTSALRIRAGAIASIDDYGFVQRMHEPAKQIAPSSVDPPPLNLTAGVHGDVVLRLGSRIELVPGIRADIYRSTRGRPGSKSTTTVPALDPRVSARINLARDLDAVSSVGLMHQYPALRVGSVPSVLVTGSGFPVGNEKLQTALKAAQGFELVLPADLVLTATGFLSFFSGLTDLTEDCIQVMPPTVPPNMREPPYQCPDDQPVPGRAYGLEFSLRRPLTTRLHGQLSYTLSRSTRKAHFVTLEGREVLATVPSESDRTHVLSAILGFHFGRGWHTGGRFVFYSGSPYSALAGNVPIPPYNDRRTPAFYRIDVRLEKRWSFGRDAAIALVLEGQNVTLRKEVIGIGLDCMGELGPTGGTNRCQQSKFGPITIPSIGVEAFF
jgi:hypothetical protein